ncbi:MAG: hypothetical protein IIW56_02190 [Oscillospiraceae bacterium]|nr:hypothetical protein [Oscillospiraceae bacterium]
MDNPNISETSREKLEDAAAFVIMEQYAKALNAGINKRMEDCAEEVFPEELDKRCRALIAQASRKAQNKKRRKSALRVLRSAAVVALVMLSLCSVLFVSVDAFRVPVMNFFIEKTDRYWQMTANPKEDTIPVRYDTENPLDGIIADIFELTSLSGSVESGDLLAIYNYGDNVELTLLVNFSFSNTQIDGEDSIITDTKVADHAGQLYVEGDSIRLVWLDENVSRAFGICAKNVSEETVTYIAEEFAQYFD